MRVLAGLPAEARYGGRRRVSYSGNTSAFQADAGGSIPPTRSKNILIWRNNAACIIIKE
jgi:hypothetical protein